MKAKLKLLLKNGLIHLKKRGWLVLVLFAALGIYFASTREKAIEVEVFTVEEGEVRSFLLEEATTRLEDEYILTLPMAGEIPRLDLKVGDYVEVGETILSMRRFARQQELQSLEAKLNEIKAQTQGIKLQVPGPEDFATAENQIASAKNLYQQSQEIKASREIELADQEKNLTRLERLLTEDAISLNQVENLRKQVKILQKSVAQDFSSMQTAKENLNSAQLAYQKLKRTAQDQKYLHLVYGAQKKQLGSQINLKQDELHRSQLRSPVSGPVLEIFAPNQGLLNAGSPIIKIGDLNTLQIETDLLSEDIYQVAPGQKVEISGKALNDKILIGKVKKIFPEGFTKISTLGVEQQRVKVIISLPKESHLKPGTRIDTRIITAQKSQVIRIPERALFKQDNTWHVFKIQDHRLQLQAVKIGLKNEHWAEISSGLSKGEQIVSRLENNLKPEQKISNNKHPEMKK